MSLPPFMDAVNLDLFFESIAPPTPPPEPPAPCAGREVGAVEDGNDATPADLRKLALLLRSFAAAHNLTARAGGVDAAVALRAMLSEVVARLEEN
mmetsp:Transcript_43794/g.140392  ORF Transcript_43794/g.140392 Transcript_43794/m.140392 type:complete len:95 (-) Transcript_43794:91-375(-)